MPGSGTRTFLEPDHYEASLRQAQIEIVIALSSKFKARLTWAELHDLQVLRCEEDFARVAYVCLGPQFSFVTFPAHSGSLPVWGGTELRAGRDRAPRPRRAAAPVNAWLLRVERDSTGPGAARDNMVGLFPESLSLCHRREKSCVPPRAMWRACGACMRKSAASPRQSPDYWRIRRSRAPSSKV